MMNKDKFLAELKELLYKYNASIEFVCGDGCDICGFYDDHIQVKMNDEVILTTSDWELTKFDIKINN